MREFRIRTIPARQIKSFLEGGLILSIPTPGDYELKIEEGALTVKKLEPESKEEEFRNKKRKEREAADDE